MLRYLLSLLAAAALAPVALAALLMLFGPWGLLVAAALVLTYVLR